MATFTEQGVNLDYSQYTFSHISTRRGKEISPTFEEELDAVFEETRNSTTYSDDHEVNIHIIDLIESVCRSYRSQEPERAIIPIHSEDRRALNAVMSRLITNPGQQLIEKTNAEGEEIEVYANRLPIGGDQSRLTKTTLQDGATTYTLTPMV